MTSMAANLRLKKVFDDVKANVYSNITSERLNKKSNEIFKDIDSELEKISSEKDPKKVLYKVAAEAIVGLWALEIK